MSRRLRRAVVEHRWLAALLGLFCLWSVVPVAVLSGGGDVFNGSDGLQVDDHMQYLAFIRDSGEHVLLSNLFDVVPDPHLFLHPVYAISGLLWAAGASVQLAFLVWKPLTVALLAVGFLAYVSRFLGHRPMAALAALAIALFYFSPAAALAEWLGASAHLRFGTLVVALEPYVASYPWSGFSGGLSVACMPLFLLAIERVLVPERRSPGHSARRYVAAAGAAGLFASWLHPWQGIVLLVTVGALVAWDRFDRRWLAAVLPIGLTAAPLIYFFVLTRTASSWATVSQVNDFEHAGLWLALGLAPALLALPGVPGRDLDLQERVLRIWPLAAFLVYAALQQSWFYHAIAGLTLPLGILAVQGFDRLRLPRAVAVAAVAALTLPGLVFTVLELRESREEHFLARGERRALAYLDRSPRPGAVLARQSPLGIAVPGFSGRKTYVGHYYWTPDYYGRVERAEQLISGNLDPAATGALLRESRASFVASDCSGGPDLEATLEPWLVGRRSFGCATIFEVSPTGGGG